MVLAPPGFHHLHLNSLDPEPAIDFYVRHFPRSRKTAWAGLPALAAPNDVLVLFTRVAVPPVITPQSAFWHFGWHVTDTRARYDSRLARVSVTCQPRVVPGAPRRHSPAPLHDGRRWLGLCEQRHVAELRPHPGLDESADRGGQGERRAAYGHRRLRLPRGTGPRARGVCRQSSRGALQPRAHVSGPPVLCAAL